MSRKKEKKTQNMIFILLLFDGKLSREEVLFLALFKIIKMNFGARSEKKKRFLVKLMGTLSSVVLISHLSSLRSPTRKIKIIILIKFDYEDILKALCSNNLCPSRHFNKRLIVFGRCEKRIKRKNKIKTHHISVANKNDHSRGFVGSLELIK
jgi:hypothetical protein